MTEKLNLPSLRSATRSGPRKRSMPVHGASGKSPLMRPATTALRDQVADVDDVRGTHSGVLRAAAINSKATVSRKAFITPHDSAARKRAQRIVLGFAQDDAPHSRISHTLPGRFPARFVL